MNPLITEAAPAQHEIDFRYGEIRKIADCITTFKMAVRIVAKTTWPSCDIYAETKGRSKWIRNAYSVFAD